MTISDQALAAIRPPPGAPASAWAERITACWRASLESILEVGRLLSEAKEALPHGSFGQMIELDLPFTARTAQMLMAIAADPRITNPKHVSHLPASWGTLYEITKLDDAQFEEKIADGTIRPDVERNEVAGLVGKRNAESRRQIARELSDTSALMPIGRKFPVVYADPAWKRKAGIGDRAYENHYRTMTWDEICALPVADMVLPDAWLFLWMPRAHVLASTKMDLQIPGGELVTVEVPLAWRVMKSWGFDEYSTCCVWTKTDEASPDDHGTGLIFWDQDELLLLFKRGNGLPKPDSKIKFGSNHRERPREHSRKPGHYRRMIRAMAGEGVPVLELFARNDPSDPWPADWYTWGNEAVQPSEAAE